MIFNGKNGKKVSKELKTLSVEMAKQVSGGSMGGGDKIMRDSDVGDLGGSTASISMGGGDKGS